MNTNDTTGPQLNEVLNPLENTPWTTDEEIYEFVVEKRNVQGLEWDLIKNDLIKGGLDPDYADAIIANILPQYSEVKKEVRLEWGGKVALGIVVLVLVVYLKLFTDIMPRILVRNCLVGAVGLIIYGIYQLRRKF